MEKPLTEAEHRALYCHRPSLSTKPRIPVVLTKHGALPKFEWDRYESRVSEGDAGLDLVESEILMLDLNLHPRHGPDLTRR